MVCFIADANKRSFNNSDQTIMVQLQDGFISHNDVDMYFFVWWYFTIEIVIRDRCVAILY